MPRPHALVWLLSCTALGCGYASYEVRLDAQAQGDGSTDAGTDAGVDAGTDAGMDAGTDAGTDAGFDAGMRVVGTFSEVCTPSSGTVIRDGDPGDDAVAASLGSTVASACGFSVRTVNQTDAGILDPSTHRPLLGPSDLGIVGGDSTHSLAMAYLEPRDAPVYVASSLTDYVLRDRATGTLIKAEPKASITQTHDVGVVEVSVEPVSGTVVLTAFGYGMHGAEAAAYFFAGQIAPNLATDTHSYYVVTWTNGDSDPNPSAGDAFTVITTP